MIEFPATTQFGPSMPDLWRASGNSELRYVHYHYVGGRLDQRGLMPYMPVDYRHRTLFLHHPFQDLSEPREHALEEFWPGWHVKHHVLPYYEPANLDSITYGRDFRVGLTGMQFDRLRRFTFSESTLPDGEMRIQVDGSKRMLPVVADVPGATPV